MNTLRNSGLSAWHSTLRVLIVGLVVSLVVTIAGCSESPDDDQASSPSTDQPQGVQSSQATNSSSTSAPSRSGGSPLTNVDLRDDNLADTADPTMMAKAHREITAARERIMEAGGFTPEIVDGLEQLHELYPNHNPTTELYARALEQTQDWDRLADLMLESPPADRTSAESMKLAEALLQVQRYEEAADAIEPVLDVQPPRLDAVRLAATASVHCGRMSRAAEILDAHWDELVANRRYEILYLRGVTQLDAGETVKGIEYLREMIKLVPEYSLAHEALGRALIEQGDRETGEQHLEQARKLRESFNQPELIELRVAVLGRAAANAAQHEQFDQCLQFISEIMPYAQGRSLAAVYQLRAKVLQAQGKPELARQSAQQAEQVLKSIAEAEAAEQQQQ